MRTAFDSFLPLFDQQIPLLKAGFDTLPTDDAFGRDWQNHWRR